MLLHAIERGAGPALVLLHGVFGSARSLGSVQRRLASTRRVIALDARNHGQSPHASDMRYPTLATDVLETLEHLGALPCDLLGHSMGGKTAMWLALFHPDAVRRLIVADVAPAAYRSDFHRYIRAMLGLPLVAGLTRATADIALSDAIPDPLTRGFLLLNLIFPIEREGVPRWQIGLVEIGAAIDGLVGWPDPGMVHYDGPTLFVAGERSDYILPSHRNVIDDLFPFAVTATLPGAGHLLHADNPEGFSKIVSGFLGAIS